MCIMEICHKHIYIFHIYLQLTFASSEAPGKIDSAVKDAEQTAERINQYQVDQEQLSGDISNHLADVHTMVKTLSGLTMQIQELERYSKYLQMIGRIEDFR